jgi:hypothetical protein
MVCRSGSSNDLNSRHDFDSSTDCGKLPGRSVKTQSVEDESGPLILAIKRITRLIHGNLIFVALGFQAGILPFVRALVVWESAPHVTNAADAFKKARWRQTKDRKNGPLVARSGRKRTPAGNPQGRHTVSARISPLGSFVFDF